MLLRISTITIVHVVCLCFRTALADAYRSITLKPDWGKGYYKLVTCLNEMGYLTEATEYANEGMRRCPTEENIVKNLKIIFETVG